MYAKAKIFKMKFTLPWFMSAKHITIIIVIDDPFWYLIWAHLSLYIYIYIYIYIYFSNILHVLQCWNILMISLICIFLIKRKRLLKTRPLGEYAWILLDHFTRLTSLNKFFIFLIGALFIDNAMPDCWLEVSIRKVLRPVTSTQVFLGFPVSTSECWDGYQVSKLPLHASHVALPT